ncbi:MAG: hypothetical protein RBS43_11340, partial [Candidatus Cloacimonas sp.]|nr:hypothetical protein [Candidatus Cloacimonas sp.]
MDSNTVDPVFLEQLNVVVNTLNSIVTRAQKAVDSVEEAQRMFDPDYEEAMKLIRELEENSNALDENVMEDFGLSPYQLNSIFTERRNNYGNSINKLEFQNWPQFVRNCQIQSLKDNSFDFLPWDAMLTDIDLEALKKEQYSVQYKWDKWDYVFVGAAGVLAALTDFLLVKIPKTMKYEGAIRKGSPITDFLKKTINSKGGEESWFSNWANNLEKTCKVPYDAIKTSGLKGIGGRTHRLQTFGHDPVLGFIFGVLDIMRGTITGFSYDKPTGIHSIVSNHVGSESQISLIEVVLREFGHLVSDVGTPEGIQAPFFTLFQSINITDPLSPHQKTYGEIARWMYFYGYDLRHFITMGITPGVIEIILRLYLMIKHYSIHGEVKFKLADNPKYRS